MNMSRENEKDFASEFVPYGLAMRMKRLGYNKPSLGYFDDNGWLEIKVIRSSIFVEVDDCCLAPTWQSAFEFFRDKYNLWHRVIKENGYSEHWSEIEDLMFPRRYSKDYLYIRGSVESYYEAQLRCLDKLLDIVEKHKSE